jgi:SAM-dependent methyltransferase
MSGQIIGLQDWFQTPAGRYLLEWERAQFDLAVADIFGYHALQLGLPALDALRANRMPYRWQAHSQPLPQSESRVAIITDFAALPFAANSLDLVLLPHTLEFNGDPHATLREVERVLVPEGRVVICGLNPTSLWGLRQRRAQAYQRLGFGELFLPGGDAPAGAPDGGSNAGQFAALIGARRLRDWLRLLSFEVESSRFGCYKPSVVSEKWLQRFDWMDRAGPRWWPIFGAVYFLVAVKRVRGMRLTGPLWKPVPKLAGAPATATNRNHKKDAF